MFRKLNFYKEKRLTKRSSQPLNRCAASRWLSLVVRPRAEVVETALGYESQDLAARLRKAMKPLEASGRELAKAFETLNPLIKKTIETFKASGLDLAKLGWTIPMFLGPAEVCQLLKGATSHSVDERFIKLYGSDYFLISF